MSDDKSKRGPGDASRISLEEDYEVDYWTGRFGVSAEQLRQAVAKVGHGADAVARELKG